jgi:hypothetical protein
LPSLWYSEVTVLESSAATGAMGIEREPDDPFTEELPALKES